MLGTCTFLIVPRAGPVSGPAHLWSLFSLRTQPQPNRHICSQLQTTYTRDRAHKTPSSRRGSPAAELRLKLERNLGSGSMCLELGFTSRQTPARKSEQPPTINCFSVLLPALVPDGDASTFRIGCPCLLQDVIALQPWLGSAALHEDDAFFVPSAGAMLLDMPNVSLSHLLVSLPRTSLVKAYMGTVPLPRSTLALLYWRLQQ